MLSTWLHVFSIVILYLVCCPMAMQAQSLLWNGSFEQASESVADGWSQDARAMGLGSPTLSTVNVVSGRYSLRLAPNSQNALSDRAGAILGMGQAIPASGLSGRQLYLSAWMNAESGSTAVVRVVAFFQNGGVQVQEIRQSSSASGPALRRDVLLFPNQPQLLFLVVMCLAEGNSGAAYFDDLNLSVGVPADWLEANGTPDPGPALDATITVNAARTLRKIPSTLYGTNVEWPWNGNGIWDPEQSSLNDSIVTLARDMGVVLHRFPGGVLSDFYSWRNGVGPQNLRPETEIYPGGPRQAHTFGTDEALAFAQNTGGQLLITVNVVTGTASEAADWVRYVNGSSRRVTYWEIGNESYAAGTSGLAKLTGLTPEIYAARFLEFARAMRAADPGIKIGIILDENYSRTAGRPFPDWTEKVLTLAAAQVDFVTVHCAYAPVMPEDRGWSPRTVYSALLAAPALVRNQLEDLSRRIQVLSPDRASQIRIGVTEWAPLFQDSTDGRYSDHTKTLGSALFVASALKTFIESAQTDVANLFKLVDANFMGWIGIRHGNYTSKATVFAMQMFTQHFGTELVSSATTSPSYDSPTVGWVDAVGNIPYLETVSSASADRQRLYVLVINKHFDRAIKAEISIDGFSRSGNGTVYTLNGTGLDANTGTQLFQAPGLQWARQAELLPDPHFYPGGANEVGITGSALTGVSSTFHYLFPAHSVTSIMLESTPLE